MGKFDTLIEKYTRSGVSTDNIEYAILAVKNGSKREHILENLTADYRGMTAEQATAMLEDLFAVNGGEFKKENQGGYLFGAFFLMVGVVCSFLIFKGFNFRGTLVRPTWIYAGAIVGVGGGLLLFIRALRGKYRDHHDPFS